ncbi:MAG: STAS domain-containing protein [Planctomycetes bacterium]|nr:STAS domain-containing protein [Planctomycetota bacterium]
MSIETKTAADVTVIKIDGDLAGINAEDLRAAVEGGLAEGVRDFVLDLSDAPSCDSAGLEALTWFQRECEDRLGLLKLCGLSPTFHKILEITRLGDRFVGQDEPF